MITSNEKNSEKVNYKSREQNKDFDDEDSCDGDIKEDDMNSSLRRMSNAMMS